MFIDSLPFTKRFIVAPGMDRVEVCFKGRSVFWVCDEARINKKYNSACKRWYIPIQLGKGKRVFSLTFNHIPIISKLLIKYFNNNKESKAEQNIKRDRAK